MSGVNYPQMLLLQEYLEKAGVEEVIACPGSRSAPLTLTISREGRCKVRSVLDERSAAFFALGLAKASGKPVAVITTSGSAVANLFPAVTEAFFSQVPLILLTADRPPEAAGNKLGQAIWQHEIFGKHVLFSVSLPHPDGQATTFQTWKGQLNRALRCALSGPIHLNFHFSEPLYPDQNLPRRIEDQLTYEKAIHPNSIIDQEIIGLWKNAESRLIIIGETLHHDNQLKDTILKLEKSDSVLVIKDPLSNMGSEPFELIESALSQMPVPSFLVTMGGCLISKRLNNYIKSIRPKIHIHFGTELGDADPWGHITHRFNGSPMALLQETIQGGNAPVYKFTKSQTTFGDEWNERNASGLIFQHIPLGSHFFVGNSMPVRWAAIHGVNPSLKISANRGCSGIEGVLSTAIGMANHENGLFTLMIGDLSFFYDSQSLFIEVPPENLRIIILNNGGGGIFRRIEGPSNLPECETLFALKHQRTAKWIAHEAGIDYFPVQNLEGLRQVMKTFWARQGKARLMEVFVSE